MRGDHPEIQVVGLVIGTCEVVHKKDPFVGILFVFPSTDPVGEVCLREQADQRETRPPGEGVGQDCCGGEGVWYCFVVPDLILGLIHDCVKSNNQDPHYW